MALDPAAVPEPVRGLLPLAERWSIGDDYERDAAAGAATPEELAEMVAAVDAVPRDGGYGNGIVARSNPKGALLEYFLRAPEQGHRACTYADVFPKQAIVVGMCDGFPQEDRAIVDTDWPCAFGLADGSGVSCAAADTQAPWFAGPSASRESDSVAVPWPWPCRGRAVAGAGIAGRLSGRV